jgi:hypothetical protein
MTKAELQEELKEARESQRRLKRSLSLALMDLEVSFKKQLNFQDEVKPSNHAYDAIKRAKSEFELNVTEPGLGGDSSRINLYIKSSKGMGFSWLDDYTENGQSAWCGAFVAFCYTELKLSIRKKILPSCYRLYESWNNSGRRVNEISIGDIVTVFTNDSHSPKYGNHIVLAISLIDENGEFETLEGNAKGAGPNGDWREGVSKRTRNINNVACIYRLKDCDFDE